MDQADAVLLIVNGALVVLTAAGAVAALVQAREAVAARSEAQKAQEAAEVARDESTRLSRIATAAFIRQAEAQERANELTEAQLPKPAIRWEIGHDVGDTQRVVNTGDLVAYDVSLAGNNGFYLDDDSRSDRLVPGDSVTFAVWMGSGMDRPRLTIRWADMPGGEQHEASIAVSPVS